MCVTSGERATENADIAHQGAAGGVGGGPQHEVQGEESQHHGSCYLGSLMDAWLACDHSCIFKESTFPLFILYIIMAVENNIKLVLQKSRW